MCVTLYRQALKLASTTPFMAEFECPDCGWTYEEDTRRDSLTMVCKGDCDIKDLDSDSRIKRFEQAS